ncbi:hypothetical protein K7X08_001578 [Anisodus acutangulus]|uniref:Uncharacterized protein n=1 Tax=Anisodus acutangulus TaxID=402998 RepID=A0A9Q1RP89_9SOLA|nr:hypothetical protein K7X08_001578 [Anisodus acutangulus]
MKNLRHVHLRGHGYLPSPRRESILNNKHLVIGMPILEEFSTLCSSSCTNEVLSSIPNLKRLRFRVNYSQTDYLANRLIDMSSLAKLESFKCLEKKCYWPISFKHFVFPTSLKRLTLDGWFQFPLEDISTLVMLPNLEELKLKDNATSGEVWRLSDKDKFQRLKLLLLHKMNFSRWEASSDSFPNLKRLVLKDIRWLEEIPTDFGEIFTLESIELHNCNTHAEDSARKIEQEQEDMGNNSLKVYINSSYSKRLKLILRDNLALSIPNAEPFHLDFEKYLPGFSNSCLTRDLVEMDLKKCPKSIVIKFFSANKSLEIMW